VEGPSSVLFGGPVESPRANAMMLSEEEGPLSAKQIEYIKLVLDRVKTSTQPDCLVLDPLLDKMHRALKSPGTNEVEFAPNDDWTVTASRFKHKKSGHEMPANMWGDILEKNFLKHKIHFEFHEASTPKYVVFFKIFNEAFGRREDEIERLLKTAEPAKAPSLKTRRVKKDKTTASEKPPKRKSQKKKSRIVTVEDATNSEDLDDRPAPPLSKRHERHLRKRESNLSSASSSSRN